MKTFINLLYLSFLFYSAVYGQHTISYTFSVEDCDQSEDLVIMRGEMLEGEKVTFEEYNFPQGNAQAQLFYNLMIGGELGFPLGSLNENIHCEIKLTGLCEIDFENMPKDEDISKLLFLVVNVTGEESGPHGETEYYYLENEMESYLRLPLEKLLSFLNFVSYSIDDFTPFFVDAQSQADFGGIRKEVEEDFFVIYTKHFSTIGVGFQVEPVTGFKTISGKPEEFNLAQNYPNPFNPSTTINYTISKEGFTKLLIYNSIGQEIQSLVNENQNAGSYSVRFNAANLSSGLYFYTITSGNFSQTNKMILSK